LKNQVFVCLAVIANTLGNFLLSVGMHRIQLQPSASPLEYLRILQTCGSTPASFCSSCGSLLSFRC
jgi:hypothetical protein